jgi:hypothetical protein
VENEGIKGGLKKMVCGMSGGECVVWKTRDSNHFLARPHTIVYRKNIYKTQYTNHLHPRGKNIFTKDAFLNPSHICITVQTVTN